MKMKKLLLFASAIGGFLMASSGFAAQPLGSMATITKAKLICTASLTEDVTKFTVIGATQQKGIESSWFIANTSATGTIKITQVDSYGMDGTLLTTTTPESAPNITVDSGGLFSWTVKPKQVVRFPHDYVMVYPVDGVGGTDPELVRWFNVVISLESDTPISVPMAWTGSVERTEDLTVTPATHYVLSRTRNDCKFMS